MQRRAFLHTLAALGAAAAIRPARAQGGAASSPGAASVSAAWDSAAASPEPLESARWLVVVHLMGGNDGLNTVVPVDDPRYREARPTLRLGADETIAIGGGLALHAALRPLLPLWERRHLAVVNGVGYPRPNRSHFVSSAVWHTARVPAHADDGWLGRASERADVDAVNVDGQLSQALWSRRPALCVRPGDDFRLPRDDAAYRQALDALYADSPLGDTWDRMGQAMSLLSCRPSKPREGLDASLQAVLALMPHARVFHTVARGFDTHTNQGPRHARALSAVAGALAQFWETVEARGWGERTLVLVYSEFGRRVEENASGGTDHGAAGPLFLLGRGVRGGLHGAMPSLADLDDGDLRAAVDFRAVYAHVLERWLRVDPQAVLGFAPTETLQALR